MERWRPRSVSWEARMIHKAVMSALFEIQRLLTFRKSKAAFVCEENDFVCVVMSLPRKSLIEG